MRREIQRRPGWQAAGLILLFGLLLSLRVVGPIGAAPTKDGYVAICAGGAIVYVPAAEIGLALSAEDEPESIEERCPWFGFGSALAGVAPPDNPSVPVAISASLLDRTPKTDPARAVRRANRPRAPPLG